MNKFIDKCVCEYFKLKKRISDKYILQYNSVQPDNYNGPTLGFLKVFFYQSMMNSLFVAISISE